MDAHCPEAKTPKAQVESSNCGQAATETRFCAFQDAVGARNWEKMARRRYSKNTYDIAI